MQFLSDEYDDLAACRKKIWNQIKRLSSKLDTICTQVDRISQAIDSFEMYSYQYNIKIVGIPQVAETECPEDKTSICLKLFSCIGADITLQSIDIAHRVPATMWLLPTSTWHSVRSTTLASTTILFHGCKICYTKPNALRPLITINTAWLKIPLCLPTTKWYVESY